MITNTSIINVKDFKIDLFNRIRFNFNTTQTKIALIALGIFSGFLLAYGIYRLVRWKFGNSVIEKQPTANKMKQVVAKTVTVKLNAMNPMMKDAKFLQALDKTPQFNHYKIAFPKGHPCEGVVLTGLNIRPANLFFAELFKETTITTTKPGESLFRFNTSHKKIRAFLQQKADQQNPDPFVSVAAKGSTWVRKSFFNRTWIEDLSEIYGSNTFHISYKEIVELLDSQKIYLSPLLPLPFYRGLKKAMANPAMIVLPGSDAEPWLISDLKKLPQLQAFLTQVEANPQAFGFSSKEKLDELLQMTLYQVGAMVVKSEDFHTFIDGDGKIIKREGEGNDAIRLINACGIRGIHSKKTPQQYNRKILSETFKTAFKAAAEGIAVFPAVGMGVWRGDPNLYWRAFLDGVLQAPDEIETICVNPNHQKTVYGDYQGCKGEEFQIILEEYRTQFAEDEQALAKLDKIINLYDARKDIVQLAYHLKQTYPQKIISLFNASDPDVTLGNHVGEYVNNVPHGATTEENYTAMGTNGLCFEGITGVHQSPNRVIQT